jgi:altronate dehydratase small subunit
MAMAKARVIVIDEKDNVATALEPLSRGTEVAVEIRDNTENITLVSDIPPGHKFALRDIKKGDSVIKYGEPIGQSLAKIARGEHVHVHNVISKPRLRRK